MPLLSLDDLIGTETRESVNGSLLAIASALGLRTTAWQSGQPIRSFLSVVATKFSDYTAVRAQLARAGFLDLSSDDWLTFVAANFYGVTRRDAAPAIGYVTLTNAGLEPYVLEAGDLILSHVTSGKLYRNTASVTLPASTTLADVPIQSDEVGSDSDAAPDAITVLVSTLLDVTVTNPLAVLGADEETDVELRVRCREQQAATSPMGPKDVYAYVAKTPAYSATSAPITRTSQDLDITTGEGTTYLATAGGAPSAADVAIVQAAHDVWAEPQAFLNTAAGASNLSVAITAAISVSTSLTVAEVKAAVAVALARYFRTLPIGGHVVPPAGGLVYLDAVKSAIIGSTPGVVLVTLAAPAADVAVAAGEVPILGTATLTVTLL